MFNIVYVNAIEINMFKLSMFLVFALKHRLWVVIRTVRIEPPIEKILTCTHKLCFKQK